MAPPATHIITLKSDDKKADVMKHVKEQGGTITDDHDRVGGEGILEVHFPQDKISTLESHPDVEAIEDPNKKVSIQ